MQSLVNGGGDLYAGLAPLSNSTDSQYVDPSPISSQLGKLHNYKSNQAQHVFVNKVLLEHSHSHLFNNVDVLSVAAFVLQC